MEQLKQSLKPGRNSICECGSGKKYKKCCLINESTPHMCDKHIEASLNKLREKHANEKFIVTNPEKLGLKKMSEIILEYADEMLNMASTRDDKEKAIIMAVSAWNISFVKEDQRKNKIDECLESMNINKKSDIWDDAQGIFQELINKKLTIYKSINRFIIDFEFIKLNKHDYHLNVVSTIS